MVLFHAGHRQSHTYRAAEEFFTGAFHATGRTPSPERRWKTLAGSAARQGWGTRGASSVAAPVGKRSSPEQVCFPGAEQQMALSAVPSAERSPPGAPPAPSAARLSPGTAGMLTHWERLEPTLSSCRHRSHHFQRLLVGWAQTVLHSECPEEAVPGMGTSSAGLSMASGGWPPMERDRFSVSELDVNWKKIKSRRKCKKKKNNRKLVG